MHARVILMAVLLLTVAVAVGIGTWTGLDQAAAAPQAGVDVYLPISLRHGRRLVPTPLPEASPTPAAEITTTATAVTPTATQAITATSTAPSETPTVTPPPLGHGSVLLQFATYGGLTSEVVVGYMPSQSPWFTLFGDGTYVRRKGTFDGRAWHIDWVSGQLDADARDQLLARVLVDASFFDLPSNPPAMICVTDQPYDYVYAWAGSAEHRMSVYGLTGYSPELECPGQPVDERLVMLAGIADELRSGPLAPREAAFEVDRGTLVAEEWQLLETPPPVWPFADPRLADLPRVGGYRLRYVEGPVATNVYDAIVAALTYSAGISAFSEDGRNYAVGFRVEFPGWGTYR